jgi:hypothetical protein
VIATIFNIFFWLCSHSPHLTQTSTGGLGLELHFDEIKVTYLGRIAHYGHGLYGLF